MKSEDPEMLRKLADYLEETFVLSRMESLQVQVKDLRRISDKLERIEEIICLDFLLGGGE